MFRDSQNRITTMSLVHEKLYMSKDLANIEFKEYIRDLVNGLFQSHGVKAETIELKINVGNVLLGIDHAIPCGLIINELITNSLKYAFSDKRKGEIKVSLHINHENMVELIVSDNGMGIPSDLDFRKTESLGLRLVTILSEDQLHGSIDLDRSRGTEFKIKFNGGK
jgi:two-component sensor histidine kinase